MNIHWTIEKHEAPGGAWLVTRTLTTFEEETSQTEDGETVTSHNTVQSKTVTAYTTLSHARRSIVDELRLSKRVRMSKHSDLHYTYNHP
jgi:hypothetical protein